MYLISYSKIAEPSYLQLIAFPQYSFHSQSIAQFIKQRRKIAKKIALLCGSNLSLANREFFPYPRELFRGENDFKRTYRWFEYFLWLTRTSAQSQTLAVENLSDILIRGLLLMVCRAQTAHCHLKPKPWKPGLSMA